MRLDLPRNDLYPATTILVPLPMSSLHYFIAKVTPTCIAFELLRLARTVTEGRPGKFTIGDRSPLDVARLKARRQPLETDAQIPGNAAASVVNLDASNARFVFSSLWQCRHVERG